MPNKQEVLNNIQNVAYSAAQVKHLIGSITSIEGKFSTLVPLTLKRGDVWREACNIDKKRPIVCVKVLKDIVIGIPLSTTKDHYFLHDSKSRFFGEGYFVNQIVTSTHKNALDNFCGVYDNPKMLNDACRQMRIFLNKVI